MLQLFKKTWHFAIQEFTKRLNFWYKIAGMLFVKAFFITGFVSGLSVFISFMAYNQTNSALNHSVIYVLGLWSLVALFVIPAVCWMFYKIMQYVMNFMATSLATAYDQKPEKIVSVQNIYPFLLLMVSFFGLYLVFFQIKTFIVFCSGLEILSTILSILLPLFMGTRLHFAYFILLENLDSTASMFQLVCDAVRKSWLLTQGKFAQLFWIVAFTQFFSIAMQIVAVLSFANVNVTLSITLISGLMSLLLAPLFVIMYARTYVLLKQSR
ncbi:hypothetical protein KBB68_03775 [Candidatus Babeliales bacterium]|nr:hypothetical protein [Candidatus Babeliales bacterium]